MQACQVHTLSQAFKLFSRHTSPILLMLIMASFIVTRVYLGGALDLLELSMMVGLILYWPFQEWWMHRFLLHLPPISWRGRSYEMDFARIHRLHHADPKDLVLAFLPAPAIIVALIAFTSVFYLVSGSMAYTCTWMATATASSILYEWVHFLTHTDYKPNGQYYRRIWKLHRWHHYKNEHYWFSFTVPWVDQWLGTGPQPKDVPHSPTARQINPTQTNDEGVET